MKDSSRFKRVFRSKYLVTENSKPSNNGWKISLIVALTAGIFALIGTALGAYLTTSFNYDTQVKLKDRQDRQETYSKIVGKRAILTQLIFSKVEAEINYRYNFRIWALSGQQPNSIYLQETNRWMQISRDTTLEIAKNNEEFQTLFGNVQLQYSGDNDLKTSIDEINKFDIPEIDKEPDNLNLQQIVNWRKDSIKEASDLIKTGFENPTKNLIEILKTKTNPK